MTPPPLHRQVLEIQPKWVWQPSEATAGENQEDIGLFRCLLQALLLHALGRLRGLPHIGPLLHGALQRLRLLLVHLHVINLLI